METIVMARTLIWIIVVMALYQWAASMRISEKMCQEYAKLVTNTTTTVAPSDGQNATNEDKHREGDDEPPANGQCPVIAVAGAVAGAGAESTESGEFPHTVAIGFTSKKTTIWACGGNLISDLYVLTAGRCLNTRGRIPASTVRIGTRQLTAPESTYQDRKIVESIRHPRYQMPTRNNDLGLLKVDEPFVLSVAVQPVCLETEDDPEKLDSTFLATGFKTEEKDKKDSLDELRKMQLNYVSGEICNDTWRAVAAGKFFRGGVSASMICAGTRAVQGDKDDCPNDKGGSLQRALKEPLCGYSLVGVVSYGWFCGEKNVPVIYTKVSSHLDWIESVVWPGQ